MAKMSVQQVRDGLAEAVNQVAYRGERILIERHGKTMAALVSVEDLQWLERLEDEADLAAIEARNHEPLVPWEEIKARLHHKRATPKRT